ncbi:hypothetical protein F3N42_02290 [Marinihelvus fidelis]|uniref:Uncharacterized protein n=1 Tax=Marinihelvus fidelis TaxID=2613842 RepID=A0A5N0TFA0_9GAMM|nr:hypothetical protein [Marinihelvus fidelis]KAA9133208.1 hypothetical protein F3N42_02290 [Marinihelvus fidelis]
MQNVQAALKWLIILALLLLFMLVALWGVSRMMYPTKAQRQAIEVLRAWPEFEGENAYALLWTLERDVPDGDMQAVLDEDVRNFDLEPYAPPSIEGGVPERSSSAANAYPDLGVSDEDRQLFCKGLEPGCLQRVMADPDRYNALVERYAPLLDRVERLQHYGHVRSAFPYTIHSPWPNSNSAGYLRTRHAVQFANGAHQQALSSICRDITTWRRLGVQSDSLITLMIGIAYSSRENGRLFAEMLAELPADESLPSACDEALAPPTSSELSLCNAMRGEFAFVDNQYLHDLVEQEESTLDRMLTKLTLDPEASLGLRAEGFVPACRGEGASGDERSTFVTHPQRQATLWRFECISNLAGCVLDQIALPAYGDYDLRVQDHGARLRALGTLAWLRQNAGQGRSAQSLLEDRPAELVDPGDDLAIGPDGETLQLTLRWTGRGEHWMIPLPASLHAQAP